MVPNITLIELINTFHKMGGKTAIASIARKENLINAIDYLGLAKYFDLIFAGIDVKCGKPDPEIYNKAMTALGVLPSETLIFEDSDVGVEAAIASRAKYMAHPTKCIKDWNHIIIRFDTQCDNDKKN